MAHERGYRPTQGAPPTVSGDAGGNRGDDFPVLCETCLGPNPYVRMVKLPYGDKQCQLTNAPFQAFRWKVKGGRTKETIVTPDVARERNICQACLSDLQFGVPVGVRDSLLQRESQALAAPRSYVNAQYFYRNQQDQQQDGGALQAIQDAPASRQLLTLSRALQASERRQTTAWRNLPKLCTFWLSGTCTRVTRKACPFRPCNGQHVFPELASTHSDLCKALIELCNTKGPGKAMKLLDDETKNALREALKGNKADKIKQRIHGEDDLSKKYLSRMKSMNLELSPPEDTSITTLWVGGVQENMSEDDLRDAFYAYGEIRSVFIVRAQKCAFIEYTDRTGAENGAKHLYGALMIRGQPLALNWSRPKAIGTESGSATEESGPMQMLPPPGLESDPVHKYALPHMPLPVGEIPPPQPPPGPPPQQRGKVRGRDGVEAPQPPTKRSNTAPTKTEDALPSVLPDSIHAGAAPAAQSFTHTAGPTRNKPPVRKGPPLPRKPQYPSMSAQRMGSQY